MHRYLIYCALVASAATQAGPATQQQQVATTVPKTVSTRSPTDTQQAAPPRHLTDEQRAELRRQLRQFNRQHPKHS